MIKFFRKIRQQLLSEGKTGKYLKYAIGEIILVVIGILIALSINNWNENRKNKRQLHGYLISISKNIESDKTEISNIKNLRIRHNLAAQDYMQCVYKDSMSLQLLMRVAPILGEKYLNVNKTGFDALKNSGFLANLQGSKIEDAILNYYSFYEEIHESETSMNNFIENMESALYYDDYENVSRVFKFLNDIQTQKELSEQDIRLALKHIYRNSKMLGVMQRVADEKYFSVYDSLEVKGQKITALIEKEINN